MASPSDVVPGSRLVNPGTPYRSDGKTGERNAGVRGYRQTGNTYRTAATPGYAVFIVPWVASFANTNWATRTQASTVLGGGSLNTDSTAQNNSVTWNIWLDDGTYKVSLIYFKDADQGIHNLTGVSGTQTVDAYAAAPAVNNYSEVTGVVVTAGLKVLLDTMATKNASSSAYGGKIQAVAWVRTGA